MLKAKSPVSQKALITFAISLLFSLNSIAVASSRGGRLEGRLIDPSGAEVAYARVALRNGVGAIAYETRADSRGRFLFPDVADGVYALAVEAQGFSQPDSMVVTIRNGESQSLTVRLELAAISEQIIVSATRTETPLSELGGSVSVITDEQLRRANHTLIYEPLRLMPGVAVAQTGGRGGLTAVFARGGESDYNKVLIDGVPVNAAGGLFDFSALTPENVDRVELVRGPRSALFGSDAMTSVVHVITRRGSTERPELELSAEGGSFDFHREAARLSGLAGRIDYSASFGHQATDGRFQNSDYINRSASANVGFRIAPDADLRLTSRWNNNTLGVPGPTVVLFADPDQRQKHRDLALAATLDYKATALWKHAARFVYSEFDTNSFDPVAQDLTRADRPPLAPGAFGPDFVLDFREHQKRAGVHYQTVASIRKSSLFTAGVDFERESAVFTGTFSRVSPVRNNLGLYAQDQVDWRGRLFFTAGVRVERNSGDVPEDLRAALALLGASAPIGDVGFGFSVNPKLALSVVARRHREGAAVGATRLKASFGTGIKEPSLTEAFSPNLFFLGNPSLDPERAISFDVGASQEFFGRRASLELTYFDNRFRDLIIFTFDPVTFGPIALPDGRLTNFINLERATARGLEVVAAARPLLRLRVAGNYTFLRSRQERASGALNSEAELPLLRRPRHSAAFEIGWIDQRFDATLDGSLVGRRRDIDPITNARFDLSGRPIFNGGYAKLNASGSLHVSRRVSAFARVENLLNQDYEEILGFPAYRLNFSAGLRVRLGGGR
jgi:outer membrane cobalamin receptor